MFLNNYHYIQSSYTLKLQYQYLEQYLFCIVYTIYAFSKGAQFLNIMSLFLSSNRSAALLSPSPVIAIVPFTSMYASA